MKLFNSKEDSMILTRSQWAKVFLATSIMVLTLYLVAMIFSLCGSNYFILNYQNTQMDRIEEFLRTYKIYPACMWLFTTFEYFIVLSFVLKKFPDWYYIVPFYFVAVLLAFLVPKLSDTIFYTLYPVLFYLVIPIIEQLKEKEKFNWKKYLFSLLRLLIAVGVVAILQAMILIIKAGYFDGQNHIMNLSATFIYALEYDIALSVILCTILLVYREKGDNKLWATYQAPGSSSQTSKTQSRKSLQKNLTKTQKNKIRLLYLKLYVTQSGAFLLVMVLPFLLGKVFEFLVMYLAFAITRFILGFKYSLHFKKETICITVGVIVFGILSLVVPFFYVVLIIAVTLGVMLGIVLHLSYKYKGFYLFSTIVKPDKFSLLYTYFDGNLELRHVKITCKYKGLDDFQTQIICELVEGNKVSYIAWKHNYSLRMINYKLDEAIDKLISQ